MSISQLFTKNEYKLECKDMKVDELLQVAAADVENLQVNGDAIINQLEVTTDAKVEGKLDVVGNITSGGLINPTPHSYVEQNMTQGAFVGIPFIVEAQNYGEYTLVDIYQSINMTVTNGGQSSVILQGALQAGFRPETSQFYTCILQYQGSVNFGTLRIDPNGDILIQCADTSQVTPVAKIWVGGNNGWFNTSVTFWRTNVNPVLGRNKPALGTNNSQLS